MFYSSTLFIKIKLIVIIFVDVSHILQITFKEILFSSFIRYFFYFAIHCFFYYWNPLVYMNTDWWLVVSNEVPVGIFLFVGRRRR